MIGPAIALVTAERGALPVTLVVAGLELVVFTAAAVNMRGLVQHETEGS